MAETHRLVITPSSPQSDRVPQDVGLRSWRVPIIASLVVAISIICGLMLGQGRVDAVPMLALGIPVLLLPLVWHRTISSVYILVGSALVFETFSQNFPDSFTDKVPFFKTFSSMGAPVPVPITPAELLMLAALGTVALKRMSDGRSPLELGSLFWAVGLYTLMVFFGVVHGIGTGGNLEVALWEARSQMYLFLAYLLTFNLVRDRGQIKLMMWIFLAAVAFKGVLGSWRYLVTLAGDLSRIPEVSTGNSLMAHEESIFFALFLGFLFILFMFRLDPKQRAFALLFSIPILIAFLANQRRAGILALMLITLVVCLMVFVLLPHRRKLMLGLAPIAVLLLPIYLVAFGGDGGLIGEPASAISSLYEPSDRDLRSNEYRVLEARNVKYNIQLAPVFGSGYGKPMEMFVPIPDLSDIFTFWAFIPHNTILWVWMRLGFLGFAAFWFLVGRTILEASLRARSMTDPYLRGVVVFFVAAMVAWLGQGLVDMGLTDLRETILIGVLIGLIARCSDKSFQVAPELESTRKSKKPQVQIIGS